MTCEKPTSIALIFLVVVITFDPQPSSGLDCCDCFYKEKASPPVDQCQCRTAPEKRKCTADSSHDGYTKVEGAEPGTEQCFIYYGTETDGGKYFIRGSNLFGKLPEGSGTCGFATIGGALPGGGTVDKGCNCNTNWCNCEYKLEEGGGDNNDTGITPSEESLSVSSPLMITPFFLLAASLFSILAVTKRETGMGFPG